MIEAEAQYVLEQNTDFLEAFDIFRISVELAPVKADGIFEEYVKDSRTYAKSAKRYVGYIRAFAGSTLISHLLGPNCDNSEMLDQHMVEFHSRLSKLYVSET